MPALRAFHFYGHPVRQTNPMIQMLAGGFHYFGQI